MKPVESIHRVNNLANAYQISCAVHAASVIGLDRLLADGPQSASDLARNGGFNEALLLRLLRFLSHVGVVTMTDDGSFAATQLTPHLRKINNMATGPEAVRAWASIPEALLKEESAYEIANGKSFYDDLIDKDEQRQRWALYNHQRARVWAKPTATAITKLLYLNGVETFADLGAGSAHLLAALLEIHPNIKPVLCELPQALDTARKSLKTQEMLDSVSLIACDLLKEPPPPADVYILSRVLLNLADKEVKVLLEHCRQSMSPESKLIIVEALMPNANSPQRAVHYPHDLHMMLVWGGKERTLSDYQDLLATAQLQLDTCQDITADNGNTWQMLICNPI